MKKALCLVISAALLLGLCACSSPEPLPQEPAPPAEKREIQYSSRVIPGPEFMEDYISAAMDGETLFIMGVKDEQAVFASSPDGGESWREIQLREPLWAANRADPYEYAGRGGFFLARQGKLYVLGQNAAAEGVPYVYNVYDSESGELREEIELQGMEDYIVSALYREEGILCLCPEKSFIFSPEGGEPLHTVEEALLFCADTEEGVYTAVQRGGENMLCSLDLESGELRELFAFPISSDYHNSYTSYSGSGLYLAGDRSVAELGDRDGKYTELFEYTSAGIGSFSRPAGFIPLPGGEFYLLDSYSKLIYLASPGEAGPRTEITIAYAGCSGVYESRALAKFNRENEDYVIKRMELDWEEPEKLAAVISAGDGPDLLYMGNSTDREMDNPFLNVELDESLCVDLMPYLKAEPELMEGFVPGLLEKFCVNGSLYKMPADFSVWSIAAPKELADKTEKWDVEALWEIYESLPEGTALFAGDRDSLLRSFCHFCSLEFADMEEGSCSFEEPEFARWLELIKNIKYYGYGESEGDSLEFTLIHPGLPEYCREKWGDYEYMGVPSAQGGVSYICGSMGGYSIMAGSRHRDAAWEYIKIILSYEIQDALSAFGMQVMEKNFQEKLDRADRYTEFSPEDELKFREIIQNAKGVAFGGMLEKIITEEANKYFRDEKSLEETVRLIQSRAGIYLAERK